MHFDFATVLAFLLAAVGFVLVNLGLGALLRPRLPNPDKALVYECGERPVGHAWINFNPRFYVIALVFVIFEVEVALTFPVAMVFRKWVHGHQGMVALTELVLFVAVLFTGLLWVWGRRDLEWVRGWARLPEVTR